MEELETMEWSGAECLECPGPPPEFRLPPPPRPPFLTEGTFCSEAPLAELEDCVAIPMIDASFHTNPSLQSTALILTCTVVLLLMAAIVSVVFWKHKRKVQNLLPCKSVTSGSTMIGGDRGRSLADGMNHQTLSGNEVGVDGTILYEDLPETVPHQLANHHHRHGQAPTIEMLDIKDEGRGVFVCNSPGPDPYTSQDLYNPVYEELKNGDYIESDEECDSKARNRHHQHRHHQYQQTTNRVGTSKPASEDEFAEDELSIGEPSEVRMLSGSSNNDNGAGGGGGAATWGTCPTGGRQQRERRGRSPRSLDRRRRDKSYDVGEFHEGMLLDALLQLYPSVAGVAGSKSNHSNGNSQRHQSVPSVAHRLPYLVPPIALSSNQSPRVEENPYESVPVLGPLRNYSSHGRSKSKTRKSNDRSKYSSQYAMDYYGYHEKQSALLYTQVGDDFSDTYSQPTDRLYNDDAYSQPMYYGTRDTDQVSGKLYQAQPDSSFGSDSGYSHHTTGTTGTTGTRGSASRTNHRKDKHRHSHHSHHSSDYVVS